MDEAEFVRHHLGRDGVKHITPEEALTKTQEFKQKERRDTSAYFANSIISELERRYEGVPLTVHVPLGSFRYSNMVVQVIEKAFPEWIVKSNGVKKIGEVEMVVFYVKAKTGE